MHSHRSTDPVLRAVAIHADTTTCKTAHILRHSAARSSRRISHVRMKAQGSRAIGWQARQNAGKCTIMMQRRSGARHTIRQRTCTARWSRRRDIARAVQIPRPAALQARTTGSKRWASGQGLRRHTTDEKQPHSQSMAEGCVFAKDRQDDARRSAEVSA